VKGATSDRPASLKTDACTTVEERRFQRRVKYQKSNRASAPVDAFRPHTCAQTNKTLVIPNRAESPVRNLMSADATTNGKGATSDRPASLKTDACTTVEERRFSAA